MSPLQGFRTIASSFFQSFLVPLSALSVSVFPSKSNSNHFTSHSKHLPSHSKHVKAISNHVKSNSNHVKSNSNHVKSNSNHVKSNSNHVKSNSNHVNSISYHFTSHSNHFTSKPDNFTWNMTGCQLYWQNVSLLLSNCQSFFIPSRIRQIEVTSSHAILCRIIPTI